MNTMRKRPYNNRNNSGGGRHRRSGGGRYNSGQSLARQKQTALQKKENYLNQARDALSSGDRVMAEYYFQHVEHWSRTVGEILEQLNERDDSQNDEAKDTAAADGNVAESDDDNDGDAEETADAKPAKKRQPRKKSVAAEDESENEVSSEASDEGEEEKKPRARRGRKPKAINKTPNPNANHEETPLPDSVIPQAGAQ